MCGIVGVFSPLEYPDFLKPDVERMLSCIQHRGPDDTSYYFDPHFSGGCQRLSIVDIENGRQPFSSEDGSVVVFCNGEIYNHRELRNELQYKGYNFKSGCDVEVILHGYMCFGIDFVKKLNGQFAFAVFDKRDRTLFLCRDNVGICPLFFFVDGSNVFFGSEVKSLLSLPRVDRRINLTGLDQVMTFPGMTSPHTIFRGIISVKPGNHIRFDRNGSREVQYWDLVYPDDKNRSDRKSFEQYTDGLTDVIIRATEARLQGDVDVGCYLSGGLDSSLLAALYATSYRGLKRTFSVRFEDDKIDEGVFQRMMALRSDKHFEVFFQNAQVLELINDVVFFSEAPLKESYNVCSLLLSKCVRKNGVKVILSGEGADELFGGYIGYQVDSLRNSGLLPRTDRSMLNKQMADQVWGDPNFIYETDLHDLEKRRLPFYSDSLKSEFRNFRCTNEPLIEKGKLIGRDAFQRRSYIDFKLRLADHLLADHGDRMAYANSVEMRFPYLDKNVIEFAAQIPSDIKMNDMEEKYILKRVARPFVPEQVTKREKFSFVAPGTPTFLDMNSSLVNDILSFDRIKRQGYFDPVVVEAAKLQATQPGFELNQTFETDFLMIVFTFGILLDVFNLDSI